MKTILTLVGALMFIISCQREKDEPALVINGATIIDGTDRPPVQNAVIVIRNGRVVAVGAASEVHIPKGSMVVNMEGKYITPGFINAHGHVGDVKGIEPGHYSR